MLCHSDCTHGLKLKRLGFLLHSVYHPYCIQCIKQWDHSTGKGASIVNIGSFIPICLIQMASRFVHGVGKLMNTGGVTINVSRVARDTFRIFVCFRYLCEAVQSLKRSRSSRNVSTEVEVLPMAASPSGALPQAAPSPVEALPMAASLRHRGPCLRRPPRLERLSCPLARFRPAHAQGGEEPAAKRRRLLRELLKELSSGTT